ncbi:MAG: BlaI/MecI/CopY family transcriptional regulator [Lachnospiraceae bacterium]
MLYNKTVTISEAEMQVMRIIWDANEPLTSNEIIERLKETKWNPKTVLTFIKRLHEKEVLSVIEPLKQRNKSYISAMSESEYQKIQTHHFINKIFMGSAKGMVATLFDSDDVYGEELDEIKRWIGQKEVE